VPRRHSTFSRIKPEGTKLLVTVHDSQEVLEDFKPTGEGWKSLVDASLREYVTRQARRAMCWRHSVL
jgi:uncharacterized protein (DUF4415 family)